MSALTVAPRGVSLEPRTMGEAMQFASMLAKSTMVPREFQNRPENVLVAVQWGREIGLGPLQALQNIAVINGRPSVWGDAALALVRGSGVCDYVREEMDGDGDNLIATCRAKRKDDRVEVVSTFSVADAKKAGLWGKAGPWTQYPKRMLKLRARGFALRDAFPDVLRGVITVEEAQDIPQDAPYTTIDALPEPKMADVLGDSIPALDPEPPRPKRKIADVLNELERELSEADGGQVHEILSRPDAKRLSDWLTGAAKERWDTMVRTAMERTCGDAHEPDPRDALAKDGEIPF